MAKLSLYPYFERRLHRRGYAKVVGIDEVGRGSIAGPVVVAAVCYQPNQSCISEVYDSKQISALKRLALAKIIVDSYSVSIGLSEARSIDAEGITSAISRAGAQALAGIEEPDYLLMDGNKALLPTGLDHECLVKGDQRSYVIACASIVAKVYRDTLMETLSHQYTVYGWEKNKGYGTASHRSAVMTHGLSSQHRKTYCASLM